MGYCYFSNIYLTILKSSEFIESQSHKNMNIKFLLHRNGTKIFKQKLKKNK